VFEVDILNDTRHVCILKRSTEVFDETATSRAAKRRLILLPLWKLAAPPGTEYSDAIVAYQIGVFFRANPETPTKEIAWRVEGSRSVGAGAARKASRGSQRRHGIP